MAKGGTDFAACMVDTANSEAIFDIMAFPEEYYLSLYKEHPATLLKTILKFATAEDQDAGRITTFLSSEDHPYLNSLRALYDKNGFVKGNIQQIVEAWGTTRSVDRWSKVLKPGHSGTEPELESDEKLWQVSVLCKHPAPARSGGIYWFENDEGEPDTVRIT